MVAREAVSVAVIRIKTRGSAARRLSIYQRLRRGSYIGSELDKPDRNISENNTMDKTYQSEFSSLLTFVHPTLEQLFQIKNK